MRLKKLASTTERVNQILSKDEPIFTSVVALEPTEVLGALNWYSQYKDRKAANKYLTEFCKKANIKVTEAQVMGQVTTLGFVCRMVERGAKLDAKSASWLKIKLDDLKHFIPRDALFVEPKEKKVEAPVKSIQDRLKEKSSKCIGALEGEVDEFILSDFKKVPNTLEVMRTHDIKGVHGPNIVNFFKKWRDEFRLAILGKDPQLVEAYDNYTVSQMKKMEALYDQIISDALKIMGEAAAMRAPRARKEKTPEKQVKSLKYCAEDATLKVKSVAPLKIVGAMGLWMYQRNNRMLSYYAADDAKGLQVKGSALKNWSPANSWSKKLRKPEQVVPEILEGGKVYLKNLHDELTTKDGKVTGRVNKEVLLLRVIA